MEDRKRMLQLVSAASWRPCKSICSLFECSGVLKNRCFEAIVLVVHLEEHEKLIDVCSAFEWLQPMRNGSISSQKDG